MERIDESRFLLYLEPRASRKWLNPIDDELTRIMQYALKQSERGLANYSDINSNGEFTITNKGYRGVHFTDCGEHSTNQDYVLKNGMITNSLADFYLRYYRTSIPKKEIKKVIRLFLFYKLDGNQEEIDFIRKYLPFLFWILRIRFFEKFKFIPNRQFFTKSDDELEFYDDDEDEPLD